MANVNDDEYETLNFADESDWMDEEDEDEEQDDRSTVADMIADHFGRSVTESDYDLADSIIAQLQGQPAV